MTITCRLCGRDIHHTYEGWVDPRATGDDAVWRLTCDASTTFTAEHEPAAFDKATYTELVATAAVARVRGDASALDAAWQVIAYINQTQGA